MKHAFGGEVRQLSLAGTLSRILGLELVRIFLSAHECAPIINYNPEYGAALKIQLSKHSFRVYSSDTIFDNLSDAKVACAKIALDEAVLDYIQHGNGQTERHVQDSLPQPDSRPPEVLSLQVFYESLPRPFPESLGDRPAAEVNAPGLLNGIVQSARGSKLSATFIGYTISIGRKCPNFLILPHFSIYSIRSSWLPSASRAAGRVQIIHCRCSLRQTRGC